VNHPDLVSSRGTLRTGAKNFCHGRRAAVLWVTLAMGASPAIVPAQGIDSLVPVVTAANYLGSNLAAFGYDPGSDTMFLSAFGNPAIVKITGVSAPETQAAQTMVFESTLQNFYRNGDPDIGVTTPAQNGLVLNPLPIGGVPAYGFAVITDLANTRVKGGTAIDPSATKRLYTYSLQPAAVPGDGSDVFTSRVTLGDLQTATGGTSTTSAMGRQPAWSGDGQSLYFIDSSPAYGGLWKVGALSGAPERLFAERGIVTEPGVRRLDGGVDRIFFMGVEATGNVGGLDFVDHGGGATTAPAPYLAAAALRDFLELSENLPSQRISSVAVQGDDTYLFLYTNAAATRPESSYAGIYRLDAAGRLSKIVNRTERAAALPSVNLVFDRPQPREIIYDGPEGSFPVTQILYRDSGSNTVAGAIAFAGGDFNRDGVLDEADIELFKPQVTLRGVLKTAQPGYQPSDLRFDMNGNDAVDWKDVQVLQQFMEYVPPPEVAGRPGSVLPIQADANLDGVVDNLDFLVLRSNFGGSENTFLMADFNGDDLVTTVDLQYFVNSFGYRSGVIGTSLQPVPLDQQAWADFLATVPAEPVVFDVPNGPRTQFEEGYRSIVLASEVLKTGTGTLIFDATNGYLGSTLVQEGTLALTVADAAAASPRLEVAAGAVLDVTALDGPGSAGYAVPAGQTISGAGTVVGSMVFGAGATLAPGRPLESSASVAAVPEPGTSTLAAVGVALAAWAARRSSRRAARPWQR